MSPAPRLWMLLLLSLLVSLPGHSATSPEIAEVHSALDQVLVSVTPEGDAATSRNAVVLVDAPRQGLSYRGAAGLGSIEPRTPMTAGHQFYIESITKTFTATVVLQLAEEGLLGERGIDATLSELKIFPPEVLDQLHRIDDESYGAGITVDQLLRHRTGMKNFTYDDEGGRAGDYEGQEFAPNSLLGLFIANPEKGLAGAVGAAAKHMPEGTNPVQAIAENGFPKELDLGAFYFFSEPFAHWDYEAWKRDPGDRFAGLLNFYLSGMNRAAMFPPGQEFAYTDTNYLVLGLLVEKITGNSLHTELRQRIFDPLKMDHSYLSYATEPAADKFRKNLSELWALGLPIVKLDLNRSMMWSDAGIVSTVEDLDKFVRALATGKLFEQETTLKTMIELPEGEEMGYGRGIGIKRTGDETILFHSGGAASWMFYYMSSDTTFIGTMNDADGGGRGRFSEVHKGFAEALSAQGIELSSPY